jgi:hypothetical protein
MQGYNKSLSVLQSIKNSYTAKTTVLNAPNNDLIFLQVLDSVKEKVIQSANHIEIPIDELELCVNIIVVDAFIRCKIFENPLNYTYATA